MMVLCEPKHFGAAFVILTILDNKVFDTQTKFTKCRNRCFYIAYCSSVSNMFRHV